DAVRTYFARTEQTAPGWYRAQRDPVVGQAVRLLQESPAEAWTIGALASQTRVSRATLARRFAEVVGQPPMEFLTEWRLAPGGRPHPPPAGARRLGRPRRRLQLAVRAQRRVQAGPRGQPARASHRSAIRHRRGDLMIFGAGQDQGESETGRLEAFSDGVLAVIITIMALELKVPEGGEWGDLSARLPALLVYIRSFTYIGIYWNNHHPLLRAARRITAGVMWANLHLLFWLSLIPVLTEWIGENHDKTAPAATYGFVCFGAAVAFTTVVRASLRADGGSCWVATAIGGDPKGRLSLLGYAAATALAFVSPWIAYALFVALALIWFIPDRRFSRASPVP